MGTAIWEFMWCLDKITQIKEDGVGWVYGGKPIKREEIREELGSNVGHISENLNKLQKEGYLVLIRTPYGIKIGVNKAQKRYSQKATSSIGKRQHLETEKATSNIRQDNRQDTMTITENKLFSDKDRREMIDLFKDINPNYQNLFRRKNQSEALKRMVLRFGQEKVVNAIKSLPDIINKPYAPRITTPIQLEENLGKLIAFVNQEKSKGENKKAVFIK